MEKLIQLDEKKLEKITKDRDVVDFVKSKKETVFYYSKIAKAEKNPLLDIEIALRRCERTGFFKSKK